MIIFIVFVLGLILGSFLSVVFHRLEIDEKTGVASLKTPHRKKGRKRPHRGLRELLFGRSACDHCGQPIPWYDNLPLVSFFALRGKCRHCGKTISHYHPLLELSTGLFLAATYAFYQEFSAQFFFVSLMGLFMLLIFAYDLKHQLIPNVVVIPALFLALVAIVLQFGLHAWGEPVAIGPFSTDPDTYLLGGAVVGGFFFALSVISKGAWIGGGDIKLGTLLGLVLGWPYGVVALFLSYIIGTLYAVLLLVRREAKLHSTMPFGPMLVMAWLIVTFYGAEIVRWYNGLVIG